MKHVGEPHLHLVQSTDWKKAVITLLEPGSPYRPWRCGTTEAQEDDLVAYVLDTDPASVLTVTARVGPSRNPLDAAFDRPLYKPTIVELSTLAALTGVDFSIADAWHFSGDDALRFDRALDDCRYISPPTSRFGHNSMAAARTLLQYCRRCEGCDRSVDLADAGARDELVAHTVDPYVRPAPSEFTLHTGLIDWPAAICGGCRDRMTAEGFTRFVDFKFALHPSCPHCGRRRTREMFYGEPLDPSNIRPWQQAAGCCRAPEEWLCGGCDHRW